MWGSGLFLPGLFCGKPQGALCCGEEMAQGRVVSDQASAGPSGGVELLGWAP